MALKKLIKPIALSYLIPLALTSSLANAKTDIDNKMSDFYFTTVKGGFDQALSLGPGVGGKNIDKAYVFALEAGKKFMNRFAVSLEYSTRGNSQASAVISNETDSWTVKSDSFMVNLSADLTTNTKFTPYLKAGLGMSRNKPGNYLEQPYGNYGSPLKTTYPSKTNSKFAWQIGAGLTIPANHRLDLQVEYMFVNRGKIETLAGYYTLDNQETLTNDHAKTAKLRDHVITIGFKIKF